MHGFQRDWIGSTRGDVAATGRSDLQSWVLQYVDVQPDMSDEITKARKPLKSAKVQVLPDEENPGYYKGIFHFIPHYQLEGMDVSAEHGFASAEGSRLTASQVK